MSRKEVTIIIIGTVTGGLLQTICRRYLKSHPEFLETSNGNPKKAKLAVKNENPKLRNFFPRGGALMEFSAIITFIAEK